MIRPHTAVLVAVLLWGAGPAKAQSVLSDPAPGGPLRVARWSASDTPRPWASANPIRVGNFLVTLRVMALPTTPGQSVALRPATDSGPGFDVTGRWGRLRRHAPDQWEWTAPDAPGFYPVRVVTNPADTVDLTFVVLRLAREMQDGALNGYPVGTYRPRPASMGPRYEPPVGFIEARPEDYDVLVSPNFRLGQFLCKEPGNPRYLLVSPLLLVKLERVLEGVNDAGYATPALTVMSGFRTPAYNRAIGNTTDFSRHLWGDAADIYVDADGDGQMDDLDRDGRTDIRDARWLARVVETLVSRSQPPVEPGGLSVYRRNAAHGPFVHIDARGRRARW